MTSNTTTRRQNATPLSHRATGRDRNATARDGHLVAWAGFIFGTVLSVAMNWLHTWIPPQGAATGWHPAIAPQIMSAVWPLCLLLSVEVLSRVQWPDKPAWGLARYGGVGTVAAGSATISYGHVHDVLASWGYNTPSATVGPLVMDGLMVACGLAMLTTRKPSAPDSGPSDIPRQQPMPVIQAERLDTAPSDNDAAERDTLVASRDTLALPSATPNDSDRDTAIRQLAQTGASTRKIANQFGIHHSTVARILAQSDTPVAQHDSTRQGRDTNPTPRYGPGAANSQKSTTTTETGDIK